MISAIADPIAFMRPIIRERMNTRRSEPVLPPLCDAGEQSAGLMIQLPATA